MTADDAVSDYEKGPQVADYEKHDPKIEALIVTLRCCRAWPVLTLAPLGRCGECGERPTR